MSSPEPTPSLFDSDQYYEPHLRIPYLLHSAPGLFDDNNTQYVTVTAHPADIYRQTYEPSGFTSVDYAKDSHFHGDFVQWRRERKVSELETTGYLAGFPMIMNSDGQSEIALHMWTFNSSVMDDTFAVPLLAIKGIRRHSVLRRSLGVDIDEVSMGDRDSAFEITATDTRTGVSQTRPAVYEDLQHMIKMTELLEIPEQIYPSAHDEVVSHRSRPRLLAGRLVLDITTDKL